MSKGVGFRPRLQPPQGRRLQRSRRPLMTCLAVSGCLAVLVCVVFGLTAYNIYNNRFGSNHHQYYAGDMVSLLRQSQDLSPVFCTAYHVETYNKTQFYLLPSRAEEDPEFRRNFSFSLSMHPGRGLSFLYRAHHLIVDSSVRLHACRDPSSDGDVGRPAVADHAEFLVIAGQHNFEEWQKTFHERHVRHKVPIPQNASCTNHTERLPHFDFTVERSDDFYLVLLQYHRTPHRTHLIMTDGMRLSAEVSATRYDLSRAVRVCNATESSCRFPVRWGGHQDVVAWVQQGVEGRGDATVTFTTNCIERVAFWVPIFGVLPVVLVALTCLGCYHILVANRSLESRYGRPRQRQTETPPGYGSFSQDNEPIVRSAAPTAVMSDGEEGCASIQD